MARVMHIPHLAGMQAAEKRGGWHRQRRSRKTRDGAMTVLEENRYNRYYSSRENGLVDGSVCSESRTQIGSVHTQWCEGDGACVYSRVIYTVRKVRGKKSPA